MATIKPRLKGPMRGSGSVRGGVILSGSFTLTTAGALLSATGFAGAVATASGGFGVIKTASKTGRFSYVLDRKYKIVIRPMGEPAITGPADSSLGNTTANNACFRNVTHNSFDIQLLNGTGVDTEGATGTVISWAVFCEDL